MTTSTFAETLVELLQGKVVEIHTGDSGKTREYADYSVSPKSVIRGVLQGASGDCLIVECSTSDGRSNIVYINSWCVTLMIEPKNGMSIRDVYYDEDARQVK